MFFDNHMWGLAIGWSIVTAGILAALAYFGEDKSSKAAKWVFAITGIVSLLGTRLLIYYIMPSFTGSFGGYWEFLALSLLCAIIAWIITGLMETGAKKVATATIIFGALIIVVPLVQAAANSWGTPNKRAFSNLANIKTASAEETLPPTDQNHIIMVTREHAAYVGSAKINSPDDNIGSIFKTLEDDYTLQSVAGHLYWIAPLVYTNFGSQVGFFGTKIADTPGFVSVDAEDPNAPALVHKHDAQGNDYHIRYLPDAVFDQKLARHVYLNGYTDGMLEDATLEVDDNWRPFYTITYLQPAFSVVGQKLDKVLLVDAQTGKIDAYEPSKVPAWVDRVMSYDLVKEYVSDWGKWSNGNSTWPNWNNQYQMKPLELEFHYNTADKPVWVIPMVNINGNQNAAAGVVVYDTHDNSGTFYPGLSGQAVGDKINGLFHDTAKNPNKALSTSSVQLYTIEGRPTWVAIYVNSSGLYGGIGMLDAQEPNVTNVQLEGNKDSVVRSYKNYLASMHANQGGISAVGQKPITLTGKVTRIAGYNLNNTLTFFFTVSGDSHSFTVTLDKNSDLPLIKEGDQVTIEYFDTKDHQEAADKFAAGQEPASEKK